MATFLIQKFAHLAADMRKGAALLVPYDVIAIKDDAWLWGDQEIKHPWFRLLRWTPITVSMGQTLLSPLLAQLDPSGTPMTIPRARAFYLDLGDASTPLPLRTWWLDDTRGTPVYTVPASFQASNMVNLIKPRSSINDPDYTVSGIATAITP